MKDSLPQASYNELADAYAAMIDTKAHNAYYDRPAVQSLIHEIENQTIFEAGCGTGVYTEWLLRKHARVVAVDANENMLKHAIARNGDRAQFIQANLEEPLSFFKDGQFDGIVSGLTITYFGDLNSVFAEFSRVLKPGGWFVFSTEHPFFSYRYHNIENYYETKEVHCLWTGFKKPVVMKSYYHSLSNITEALSNNGFVIEKIIEPKPLDKFKETDEAGYEKLLKFPLFIFIRAIKSDTHNARCPSSQDHQSLEARLERRRSDDRDFLELATELDEELNGMYREKQSSYTKLNIIPRDLPTIILYDAQTPVGCGCLKKLDRASAELKRIYVRRAYRGRGLSKKIILALEEIAKSEHIQELLLETGIQQTAALGLYQSLGYHRIENYGPYKGNANSVCMKKEL